MISYPQELQIGSLKIKGFQPGNALAKLRKPRCRKKLSEHFRRRLEPKQTRLQFDKSARPQRSGFLAAAGAVANADVLMSAAAPREDFSSVQIDTTSRNLSTHAEQPRKASVLDISNASNSRRNMIDARVGEQHAAFAGVRVVGRTETLEEFNRKTKWFKDAAAVFGVTPAARKNS